MSKTYSFLTTRKYLADQIIRLLTKKVEARGPVPTISGYTLIKGLKEQTDVNHNSIGLYKNNATQQKVIIKHLRHETDKLGLHQFENEISMLELFNNLVKNTKSKIKIPQVLKVVRGKKETYLVMEIIEGTVLRESKQKNVDIIIKVLDQLKIFTQNISPSLHSKLPIRPTWIQHLTVPIYVIAASKDEPSQIWLYLQSLRSYFVSSLKTLLTKPSYDLAHKDLHSLNIMLNHNQIYLLDPQVSCLSARFTDLAMVTRLQRKELSWLETQQLLDRYLKTHKDKDEFIRLTIYFALQLLAIKNREHHLHDEAIAYLKDVKQKFIPYLFSKPTLTS